MFRLLSKPSTSYHPPSGAYNSPPGTRPPRNVEDIVSRLPPLPDALNLPHLPVPVRDPLVFDGKYTVATHLVPAAYPRHPSSAHLLHPKVPHPIVTKPSLEQAQTKGDRKYWAEATFTLMAQKREILEQVEAEMKDADATFKFGRLDDPLLWNSVNRYARIENGSESRDDAGLTLIITSANGFPKEIWEPALQHMIALSERPHSGIRLDEIWVLDAVNHGDSALINGANLWDSLDWIDHTRDILNFVEYYIPETYSSRVLPTHLDHVSQDVAFHRASDGFSRESGRIVVGMGHSFGGTTLAYAACTHQQLFKSLILVDPIIVPDYVDRPPRVSGLVVAALTRREEWPSRAVALDLLRKSPFFGAWDPSVLDKYIEYGLYNPKDGGGNEQKVRLKTSGFQEAVIFAEARFTRETYDLLESLDERVKLRWIMSGKGAYTTGGEEATRDAVWRRPVNSSNVRIAKSGHLIVHEAPYELAEEVVTFLHANYASLTELTSARL